MKIKIPLLILFSFFAFNFLDAQTRAKKREINKLTDQAEEAFYNEDYRQALAVYQQLFQMNPDGSDYYNYQIALCYLYSNIDNEKAMSYIDLAKESMAETPVSDFYYYNLGKSNHQNNKFDEAITAYKKALDAKETDSELKNEIERQIQICQNAIEITKKPLEVKIYNAGDQINTPFGDYRPLISADESMLVFTSRREGASNGHYDTDGRNFEDIYISEKDEMGYWKEPKKISSNINTELHEASLGLSADGRELILYKGNPNWGGLYFSKLVGTEWTVPQVMGENINSKKFIESSASLSADGKYMFLVSNRKGTLGEKDIWKAQKEANGEWGIPVNLGPAINTEYDEESPFIHPDGKTLYFSSKGHNSIGGYDIFKSVIEKGQWSKPENIGYPINTPGDDVHFVLTADGKNGYFTSSRTGTLGEQDIYRVSFDVSVPLILVKGIVKKEEPGEFKVSINIINKTTNQPEEYVYNPNPVTGKYLMVLPPGKNYDMVVEAENYQPQIININIPNQKEFFELYQEIILRKVEKHGEIAQEITVTNFFENIREAKKTADSPVADIGNVAASDFIEMSMKKLIANSKGRKDTNSVSAKAEIEKLTMLTDKVTDHFDLVLEAKIPTAVSTSSFSKENEKELLPMKVGNETIMAVPSTSFVAADIDKVLIERQQVIGSSQLVQLKSDLGKAKNTPKTGNYIVDLANERYIENLEEEIAAIEGGYAMNATKDKKEDYSVSVKKETGMYGTQTTAIIDKEKELAEREMAVSRKEAEQNDLAKLRDDLEKAKGVKPTGNYISDLANQRYMENLEEEIAAISGGYSPKYKQKEGFAEVKKETGLYGTTTSSGNASKDGLVTADSQLETKRKELEKREQDIARKEAELNAREKELNARETALSMNGTNPSKPTGEPNGKKESVSSTKSIAEKIIYFGFNQSEISQDFKNQLDLVTATLNENQQSKVDISAHSDSKGSDQFNLSLSRKRAENVVNYLVSKGVKKNRITMKYFGESKPLAPNANPDGTDNPNGRDKNRRAEIIVR